ncbi:MAG: hypothetical protein SGILL_004210 [Bacillariaceae sp.]
MSPTSSAHRITGRNGEQLKNSLQEQMECQTVTDTDIDIDIDSSEDEMGTQRGPYVCKECSTVEKRVLKAGHICPFKREFFHLTKKKNIMKSKQCCQTESSFLFRKKAGYEYSLPASENDQKEDIIKFGKVDIKEMWLKKDGESVDSQTA